MGDPLYHAPSGATKTMRVTVVTLAFLVLAAIASAQDCPSNTFIERIADGLGARDGWETLCVSNSPNHADRLITRPGIAYAGLGGNFHYRWKSGGAVCVYTAADRAGTHSIGGGRLLTFGNSNRDQPRGGTYFVAEVDAGYRTFAVIAPHGCEDEWIPVCRGRCGDNVRPGDGVY